MSAQESAAIATAVAPPIDDPDAPRLLDRASVDGEGCARMGEGRTPPIQVPEGDEPAPTPWTLPPDTTDELHAVFAAETDVATATAYREDDGDRIFICTSFDLRADFSGAGSAVIHVPDPDVIATVDGAGGGYGPGENVVDYFGYASDEVASVIVTTPDGREHLAALDGHVWWAAPVVDEVTASRSQDGTWRALDRDGEVIAEGPTRTS
ncbi:hypothetical protein CLV92_12711 [Kineococcus xinjiangensis]|uniref:Uncharacterized protein n=2 Tax=Kineococcus xinjiangensis TaxID=512762 RepID=A0A2S6IBZ1_9ACTN|nr:hypothetical protein CLV92_12711 [Kineococcus xinjiangensis]